MDQSDICIYRMHSFKCICKSVRVPNFFFSFFFLVCCCAGWYQLPRIPGVPRASADLPHVVHRDGQLHRHRRRSLGLLSCVSALPLWHGSLPHPHTLLPPQKAFIVSLKNKGSPLRRLWPITRPVWLYFPRRRIVDQARTSFVPSSLFRFFRGKSWIECCCLLKHWTMS